MAINSPEMNAPGRQVWGVSALLLACSDALAARFGAVMVRGELSGLSRAASGHAYFSLKDATGAAALLRCAMFRRAALLLDFAPTDGQQVELRGRLGVYDARGELQFIVESMRRVGAGSLYEEFLRQRQLLQAQGLFDPDAKRPITPFPRALGVITSLGAAALHDVLSALARRAPHVRVVIYPSLVQGSEAPAALVQALVLAGQRREVDTLLLVRGGGALEDLWAFNDERVVRAVRASPLPVICGVGHETDVTLADLAADLRAPTPTAAAEMAAPDAHQAGMQLDVLVRRLAQAVRRRLDGQAQRLDQASARLGAPGRQLAQQLVRLDALALRSRLALRQRPPREQREQLRLAQALSRAAHHQLRAQAQTLQTAALRLDALDPRRVLARGFAWVTDASGQAVMNAAALEPKALITTTWSDGSVDAEVLTTTILRNAAPA